MLNYHNYFFSFLKSKKQKSYYFPQISNKDCWTFCSKWVPFRKTISTLPALAPESYDFLLKTVIFYVHKIWLQKKKTILYCTSSYIDYIASWYFIDDFSMLFYHLISLCFITWCMAGWFYLRSVTPCQIFYYWSSGNHK